MVGEKYETYNHPHIVLYALNQSLIDDFEKLAAIYAYVLLLQYYSRGELLAHRFHTFHINHSYTFNAA